ncbi:hypothetical protein E1A91_A06G180600v1 [Gossypium mustelinum]|uniref:Uncharacterized protein n=1 Tax=Gossypium mustelinum TaxID=34275 RepID=A0A5D2YXM0_GOSMU|nr:hypothetical protein E1A91_A06G180600v1 [Gossypium mustelinum]
MLHEITIHNWWPTIYKSSVNKPLARLLYIVGQGVRFNLGDFIFKQVVKHAESVLNRFWSTKSPADCLNQVE